MRAIDIIAVPYDSGRRGWRMGAGPEAFLGGGMVRTLRAWNDDVRVVHVGVSEAESPDVLTTTLRLAQETARRVRSARQAGRFPLVLTGNCFMTVGAIAGLDGVDVAVTWLDAHGDLNTPETSASGFLDGMAAATLLGWCHTEDTARLTGFRPLHVQRFLLLGARALDAGEAEAMDRRGVHLLTPAAVAGDALERALDDLLVPAEAAWLHIDLDVLDPGVAGPANAFAAPDGLTFQEVVRTARQVRTRRPVAGLTLSALDPEVDASGRVRAAALDLLHEIFGGDQSAG